MAAGVHSIALLAALPGSALRDELLADAMAGRTGDRRRLARRSRRAAGRAGSNPCAGRRRAVAPVVGSKHWVAPGAGADGWLVLAAGPRLCWVEAGPAVELEALPRVDGSSMANLRFERAKAQSLAAGDAALAALERPTIWRGWRRPQNCWALRGRSYEMTLEYLKTRVQFGKPIGANQALQHRMVDAYIEVEIAAACLRDVVDQHERGVQPLAALASRAKARCADVALRLTRLAIQFHGAIGFTDEFDIGLYWKRAVHLASWLGAAAAHRARFLQLQPHSDAADSAHDLAPVLPRDTDWAALPEATFRRTVRAFLHAHYPAHLRHAPRRVHWHEIKDWYFALSRQGWIAPAWPKAARRHGACQPSKLLAFIEEFEDFGAARLPDQGLINLGPVLIQHGTPEQQREWLPKIISGEHVWCQGYSEPNAGSDLASLRTEAVARRRPLRRQRPEDLDHLGAGAHPHLPAGAHRQDGEEAGRHQLPAGRPEDAGHHRAPDPQHRRRGRVLRGVLRQRARAARQPGRRAERGLDASPRRCWASSACSSAAPRHASTP